MVPLGDTDTALRAVITPPAMAAVSFGAWVACRRVEGTVIHTVLTDSARFIITAVFGAFGTVDLRINSVLSANSRTVVTPGTVVGLR